MTARPFATMTATAAAAFSLAAFALAAHAKGDGYGDATAAYKTEMKRDDPVLINPGYISDRAVSQAKRTTLTATESAEGAAADARANRGGQNVASPQIYGTVRGDVNIVTQRAPTRGSPGSIVSVRR
jgi:hypothetical protein